MLLYEYQLGIIAVTSESEPFLTNQAYVSSIKAYKLWNKSILFRRNFPLVLPKAIVAWSFSQCCFLNVYIICAKVTMHGKIKFTESFVPIRSMGSWQKIYFCHKKNVHEYLPSMVGDNYTSTDVITGCKCE